MIVFSQSLQIASFFNLLLGGLLTVIGFCHKTAFVGGSKLNQIGTLFLIEAFGIMLISIIIFSIIVGDNIINKLFSFGWKSIIIYIILGANVVYRFFSHSNAEMENGFSTTGEKILAGIAISLVLNLTIHLISTNFIKLKS